MRSWVRGTAAAVVAGLALAGCSAEVAEDPEPGGTPSSTPVPREPALEQAGTVAAGGEYAVVDDVLAVVEEASAQGPDPDGAQWRVTGYRLPGGEAAWTTPLPEADRAVRIHPGPGGFVVGYAGGTAVVEPADGTRRWQAPGTPVATAAGGELVISARLDYEQEERDEGGFQITEVSYEYLAYQLETGEAVWNVAGDAAARPDLEYMRVSGPPALPPTTRSTQSGPPAGAPLPAADWLVLDDDDSLSVVDPATGEQRPLGPPDRAVVPTSGLRLAGDLALVRYWDGEDPESIGEPVAFDLATGEQRWTLTATEGGFGEPPVDCGQVICLGTFTGQGGDLYDAYGLDPATGEVRWTAPQARRVGPASPGWAGSPLLALHHRILSGDGGVGVNVDDQDARLLDPASGDVLLDLAGWRPLGSDGSWLLVYADPDVDWATATDLETVGDLAIAVVDLAELAVHEVGTVPDVLVYQGTELPGWRLPQESYLGCRVNGGVPSPPATAAWLTCRHEDGEISVWRYYTVG